MADGRGEDWPSPSTGQQSLQHTVSLPGSLLASGLPSLTYHNTPRSQGTKLPPIVPYISPKSRRTSIPLARDAFTHMHITSQINRPKAPALAVKPAIAPKEREQASQPASSTPKDPGSKPKAKAAKVPVNARLPGSQNISLSTITPKTKQAPAAPATDTKAALSALRKLAMLSPDAASTPGVNGVSHATKRKLVDPDEQLDDFEPKRHKALSGGVAPSAKPRKAAAAEQAPSKTGGLGNSNAPLQHPAQSSGSQKAGNGTARAATNGTKQAVNAPKQALGSKAAPKFRSLASDDLAAGAAAKVRPREAHPEAKAPSVRPGAPAAASGAAKQKVAGSSNGKVGANSARQPPAAADTAARVNRDAPRSKTAAEELLASARTLAAGSKRRHVSGDLPSPTHSKAAAAQELLASAKALAVGSKRKAPYPDAPSPMHIKADAGPAPGAATRSPGPGPGAAAMSPSRAPSARKQLLLAPSSPEGDARGSNGALGSPAGQPATAAGVRSPDSAAKKKKKVEKGDRGLAASMQHQMAIMVAGLFAEGELKLEEENKPVAKAIAQVKAMQAFSRVAPFLPSKFEGVVAKLAHGHYSSVEAVCDELDAHAVQHMEACDTAERKHKLKAEAKKLVQHIGDALQFLASSSLAQRTSLSEAALQRLLESVPVPPPPAEPAPSSSGSRPRTSPMRDDVPPIGRGPLPPSVENNREPYNQGEYRKEPYQPRAYKTLTDYEYNTTIPHEKEALQRKMRTARPDGMSEEFRLSHQPAVGVDECAAMERQLAAQVLRRETLRLGLDVVERDTWGMDRHTRKNIFDAVIQSGAFAHLRPAGGPAVAGGGQAAASSGQAMAGAPAGRKARPAGSAGADSGSTATVKGGSGKGKAGKEAGAGSGKSTGKKRKHPEEQADQPSTSGRRSVSTTASTPPPPTSAKPKAGNGNSHAAHSGSCCDHAPGRPGAAPSTPLSAGKTKAAPTSARMAAALEEDSTPEDEAVHEWIDSVLMPEVTRQGRGGWDIIRALQQVAKQGDTNAKAATAVEVWCRQCGRNYFRLHPKGRGMICNRPGGIPPFTFVEEYFGELHTPWRWFEIQDAIKKVTNEELPDFYNMTIERPKDDPADEGYDVLHIDAAFMGSFASRMSHSCTPNCQAAVLSCNGRLTVAVYTIRHLQEGEELTFDYHSVTESEKEWVAAYCLCGTRHCRGSYLLFAGSSAFTQVMAKQHNFLHRQAMLLRACVEPLQDEDKNRLQVHGLKQCALGRPGHDRVAPWLEKWAALALGYAELEEKLLPDELAHLPGYTQQSAAIDAKGVVGNRVMNITITLDKVRLFLDQPKQVRAPPLRMLSEADVLAHLWGADKSVVMRLVRAGANALCADAAKALAAAADRSAMREVLSRHKSSSDLNRVLSVVLQKAATVQEAQEKLMQLVDVLRDLDGNRRGGHTAAADLLLMYASTRVWFTAERQYSGFSSPPVQLHDELLKMHRYKAKQQAAVAVKEEDTDGTAAQQASTSGRGAGDPQEGPSEGEEGAGSKGKKKAKKNSGGAGSSKTAGGRPTWPDEAILCKRYGPWFMWGQLSGWFKQTVYDPTASLSAERRGTISLPDIESAYGGRLGYDAKQRNSMLDHIAKSPDKMWKVNGIWSFKNEAKVYGSPMFDDVWLRYTGGLSDNEAGPLLQLLGRLQQAPVPWAKKQ